MKAFLETERQIVKVVREKGEQRDGLRVWERDRKRGKLCVWAMEGKDKRLFFDGVRRRLKRRIKAGFHRPMGC